VLPAKGRRRARVALFSGCVADTMFRPTNWATARVLQENGCDVVVPREQGCCGAIHFHAGASEPARAFADQNLAAFDHEGVDAVIVNVAGCGAMLKDYGHHWHDAAQPARERFADKVRDVNQFLDELGLVPPTGELRLKATYHDACHLGHAQKVTEAPRRLLAQIPGLDLRELPETELCCGAAGTYNLTQPEMAGRLSRRKLANIVSTGARVVVTANAGCLLQIAREARQQGERLAVVHPMDLLDLSYRGEQLEL
jgi:glycolate oxidase iron-sulfur subunit